MVETALIYAHGRGGEPVFGRSLLERNLELCARAGINRFFIACNGAPREDVERAIGSFQNRTDVVLLDSPDAASLGLDDLAPVSYTHLDVYKRQTYTIAMRRRAKSASAAVSAARPTACCTSIGPKA